MDAVLIKNGRVFDGFEFRQADVLVRDGVVERIAAGIDDTTSYIFDVAGMTVLPGLVDVHMHMRGISPSGWAAWTDASCFPFGVTAAADAGSREGDRAVLDSFGVKSVAFPQAGVREPIDFSAVEERLAAYGDKAIGVKLCYDKVYTPELKDAGPLEKICDFAHSRGLVITIHTSNCPIPMAELLGFLEKGDIATHIYHGGGHTVSEDGFACLFEAKRRGIVLDAGLAGSTHVDFTIFADAIAAGAGPDVISTDLVWQSAFTRGGRYGLLMCMSIARHLGMKEIDIFRAVTSNAGKALQRPWGILREGGCADIAVLDYADEPFDLTDAAGCRIQSDVGYRCHLTLSDGQVVYRR